MLLVPAGTFDHDSGGVFSPPSQVYSLGIAAPLSNALDVTLICAMVARSAFLAVRRFREPTRLASENRREIDVRMRSCAANACSAGDQRVIRRIASPPGGQDPRSSRSASSTECATTRPSRSKRTR